MITWNEKPIITCGFFHRFITKYKRIIIKMFSSVNFINEINRCSYFFSLQTVVKRYELISTVVWQRFVYFADLLIILPMEEYMSIPDEWLPSLLNKIWIPKLVNIWALMSSHIVSLMGDEFIKWYPFVHFFKISFTLTYFFIGWSYSMLSPFRGS